MRKLTLLTIGLAIFMYSCKNAAYYSKKANKNFEEGNFETAIQNYQQALEMGSDVAVTNYQIAESYRLSNRLSSSSEYYKAAIDNGTEEKRAPFHYGMALKSQGDYPAAKKVLDDFIKSTKDRKMQKIAKYEAKKIDKIKSLPFTKWEFTLTNAQSINSDAEDFAPVMMGDKLVITSSRGEGELYGGNGFGFTDLYIANENGEVTKLDESGSINTLNRHEASATFTPDGKTMVFARSNEGGKKEDYPDVDLYMSVMDDAGNWGAAKRLPINQAKKWDGSPLFSRDGKYLYFVSDRKGGKGGLDLWKASFKDGKFAKPRNMGKKYNTFGNEMFPYFHENGSFYFASDGQVGYGGLDMFKVIADDKGKLTGKPINMGPTVNTTYDDFGIMYTDRFNGYICSNREGGMGGDDIYKFKEAIIPFYFLDLEVKGESGGLDHCGITFLEDGKEVESNFTDEKGHYKHQLQKDGHYEIKVEKDSFFTENFKFVLDKNEIMKNEKNEDGDFIIKEFVKLRKHGDNKDAGIDIKEFGINDILYDVGKWDIKPEAAKELDKLIGFLLDNPGITIELGSHTDSRGSKSDNKILSGQRAESAVNYIVENGNIIKERITSMGYGESRLLNKCKDGVDCSEEEHQENRRTEIKILQVKNVNSAKYEEFKKKQEAARLEREREERHEEMEEEALMMDELKEDIETLEKRNLSEDDPKYKLLEKKKAKLAEIEKHFHELEEAEEADKEVLKKQEIEESDEFLEMKKKYEEMQKMMKEMEKNKN